MPGYAIEEGSIVVVAGGTGYIGATTSLALLKAGFRVRATTRSITKADDLRARCERDFPGQFTLVEVKDWSAAGAYDHALKDASGFIVVAGDTSFDGDTDRTLRETALAMEHVFTSANRASSLKRMVLTSSRVAVYQPEEDAAFTVDENDWNDKFVDLAKSLPADHPAKAGATYVAGKVTGERAAWAFVLKHKTRFVLNTVLPELVLGENFSKNPSTGPWLNDFLRGDKESPFVWMSTTPGHYVSNDDIARLHLAALLEPDVVSERLFGTAGPYTINDCLAIARKYKPDRTFPEDLTGSYTKPSQIIVKNGRSLELLKRQGQSGWESLEEAVISNLKSF